MLPFYFSMLKQEVCGNKSSNCMLRLLKDQLVGLIWLSLFASQHLKAKWWNLSLSGWFVSVPGRQNMEHFFREQNEIPALFLFCNFNVAMWFAFEDYCDVRLQEVLFFGTEFANLHNQKTSSVCSVIILNPTRPRMARSFNVLWVCCQTKSPTLLQTRTNHLKNGSRQKWNPSN